MYLFKNLYINLLMSVLYICYIYVIKMSGGIHSKMLTFVKGGPYNPLGHNKTCLELDSSFVELCKV